MSEGKNKGGCLKKGFVILIIFAGVAYGIHLLDTWGVIHNDEKNTTAEEEQVYDKATAWVYTQDLVEKRLKTPSTADFPWFPENDINQIDTTFIINSHVDAENSFGAMIREHFYAKMVYSPNDTVWTLTEFEFK